MMYLKTIACGLFMLCICNKTTAQVSVERQQRMQAISRYYYGLTTTDYVSKNINKPNTAEPKKVQLNKNFRVQWGVKTKISWDTYQTDQSKPASLPFGEIVNTTCIEIDFKDIESITEAPLTINAIENKTSLNMEPNRNILFVAYKDKKIKITKIDQNQETTEMVSEVLVPIQKKSEIEYNSYNFTTAFEFNSDIKIIQAFEFLCRSSK